MLKIPGETRVSNLFEEIRKLESEKCFWKIGEENKIKKLSNTIEKYEKKSNRNNDSKESHHSNFINLLHCINSNKFHPEENDFHKYVDYNKDYSKYYHTLTDMMSIYTKGKTQESINKYFNSLKARRILFENNSAVINLNKRNDGIIKAINPKYNEILLEVDSIFRDLEKINDSFKTLCEKYRILYPENKGKLEEAKKKFIEYQQDIFCLLGEVKDKFLIKRDGDISLKSQVNKENKIYSECINKLNEIKEEINKKWDRVILTGFEKELLKDIYNIDDSNNQKDINIADVVNGKRKLNINECLYILSTMTREGDLDYYLDLMKDLSKIKS